MKSQKALKFVLAILTFSRVTGPGASAKAVLWKTSGQRGGVGGSKDVSRVFAGTLTFKPSAECGMKGKGKDLNRKERQERKERQRLFFLRQSKVVLCGLA